MSAPPAIARRRVLAALAAGSMGALVPSSLTAVRLGRGAAADDWCATPGSFSNPLHLPGKAGLMARLPVGDVPVVLRAVQGSAPGPALAFAAGTDAGRSINPTLVAKRGATVAVSLVNAIDEPTVVHWHGLKVDTANDGNGERLIAPGSAFDYRFTVRDRASLYWYHPHPHGTTASQAYRGLFGLLAVEDDEELALRAALELVPGETEIPLVLHDRKSAASRTYAPDRDEMLLGWYGNETLVNHTAQPFLDVAARRYRFRILNASNARNYRIALRRDDGATLPFDLIGTDGGLLPTSRRVDEILVSPAERADILVDFGGMAKGGFVLLESRAFDPMHALPKQRGERPDAAPADAHAAPSAPAQPMAGPRVGDGAPLALLQFRIRDGGGAVPPVPTRLSSPPPAPATTEERALRLGFARDRWRINDRVYEPDATPIVVARQAVETWLIRNYHSSMPHAMHLHGFHFRVLERETSPEHLAPLVVADRGRLATDLGWKDTVLVWPGESVRIAIDFRHPFADPQIYLLHCHNLEHEDGGMMLRVQVG